MGDHQHDCKGYVPANPPVGQEFMSGKDAVRLSILLCTTMSANLEKPEDQFTAEEAVHGERILHLAGLKPLPGSCCPGNHSPTPVARVRKAVHIWHQVADHIDGSQKELHAAHCDQEFPSRQPAWQI